MEYSKSEAKLWAKKSMKGLEVPIFPSFTPDLEQLDEEGIRFDVNHIFANGFTSVMAAPEVCGMTFEERKRFVQIVCDEAKGKMHSSVSVMQDTVEQDIEMLRHIEKVGGTHATLAHPVQYYPRSEEDIFRMYKFMCESTSLATTFYPGRLHTWHFHPSYFPPDVMRRIAEIPNVVAMKVTGGSSVALTVQAFQLCGDQILVSDPMPDRWFFTIPKHGQQWAGPADYVIFDQTGENPRIVRMFNLFAQGKFSKAMALYWELAPITLGARDAAFQCGMLGMKYMQWLTGGNGGMFRKPTSFLFQHFKNAMRAGLRAASVTPREPEEEFYVGRVNYSKGIRPKEYTD